jgi:glutathione reductase (NADPH)
MSFDFDLFVIGAGSGGVRAARMSAANGARVAVAESTYLGGTCVNVGCVPKKLFVYGSHFAEEFEDAEPYGWNVRREGFDWPRLRDNKTREIERLNGIYRNLLENAGVEIVWGRAELLDANRLRIGDRVVTAANVLVATGSWPAVPELPGRELAISSNEAFYLECFPERVAVVGGGYIALEFAGILPAWVRRPRCCIAAGCFCAASMTTFVPLLRTRWRRSTSVCGSRPRCLPSKQTGRGGG